MARVASVTTRADTQRTNFTRSTGRTGTHAGCCFSTRTHARFTPPRKTPIIMNPALHGLARLLLASCTVVASGCAQMEGQNPLKNPLQGWLKSALGVAPEPAASTTAATATATTTAGPAVADAAASAPLPSAAAAVRKNSGRPTAVSSASAPPAATDELAQVAPTSRTARRFSLVLSGATPETVFMSLLAETPLSVAVDPAVKAPTAISLKDVTLREALDLLRELHHLEYKIVGRHILVAPAQMQTRIFTIDYPSFNRTGRSDSRVISGSITGGGGGSGGGSSGGSGGSGNGSGNNGSTGGSSGGGATEGSRITTSQKNDIWQEVENTIKLLVGDKEGRHVIVSPQTGNIVVRALPKELRTVQDYLASTRASIERQVMLEAKVVEVQLRDSQRTGINWAAFKAGLSLRASGGVAGPGVALSPISGTPSSLAGGLINVAPGAALSAAATSAGAVLGLAFQTSNFASVLEFLGTQGNTQVLSSPRIATMNNQKALLKVGTDDFFVTSISTTTNSSGNTSSTTPNIGVQPFFSGISLDVTPSITADGFITLHVHPAVSTVIERNKVLNLGNLGTYSLPLASSDINETDAVVRARDGQIIAIGGLMRQANIHSDSGLPGAQGTVWRKLFGGQTEMLTEKRELVILLKPTIIDPNVDDEGTADSLQRLLNWTEAQAVVGKPPR